MTKTFLVTAGDYSDYAIYGAFSSRENAQQYIDERGTKDSWWSIPNIEEWEIDEGLKERQFMCWCIGMMLDDGLVVEGPVSNEIWGMPENTIDGIAKVPCYKNRPLVRVRSVESADHAMKLAVEARQKWLRGELKCR